MKIFRLLLGHIDKQIIYFGISFAFGFVIVEGWLAPDWGSYSLGPLLWQTPLLLIPIWFFVGSFAAGINKWLAEYCSSNTWKSMVTVGGTFFILCLSGEYLGTVVGAWQFHESRASLLGVPVWICVSYSLAFSFSPIFYKRSLGGLIQTGFIGIFWQVFYLISLF